LIITITNMVLALAFDHFAPPVNCGQQFG
jgi:hypothetical protein